MRDHSLIVLAIILILTTAAPTDGLSQLLLSKRPGVLAHSSQKELPSLPARLQRGTHDRHYPWSTTPDELAPPGSRSTSAAGSMSSDMKVRARQGSFAQEDPPSPGSRPDTVFEIGSRMGNQFHVYTYDGSGHVTQEVLMYLNGPNDEIRRLVSTYTPSGLLQRQIVYDQFYPGGISSRSWFTYDNEGRQTSSRYEWFNRFQAVPEMWARDSTVYDATGNVIMSESDDSGDIFGWPNGKEEIQITDSTEVRTHSQKRDGAWLPASRTSFLQERGTGTTVTLDEAWSGGKWVNQSKETTTPTPDWLTTESFREAWVDKDWRPARRTVRVRSEDGTASIDSSEEYVNGTWLPVVRGQRTFDRASGTTVELIEYWQGGWILEQKFIYVSTRDGSSREIDSIWQQGWLSYVFDRTSTPTGYTETGGWRSPDGAWIVGGWKEWNSYTPAGQPSESISSTLSGGVWTPVHRFQFTYHNDRLHSKRHFTYVDGEWVMSPVYGTYEDPEVWPPYWSMRGDPTLGFGGYAELIFAYRTDVMEVLERSTSLPKESALCQNYPNPFNPATTIPFAVSTGTRTTVAIYDVLGREVARPVDEWKDPGEYRVQFDASGLASGMYICRFTAGAVNLTTKMVLMR